MKLVWPLSHPLVRFVLFCGLPGNGFESESIAKISTGAAESKLEHTLLQHLIFCDLYYCVCVGSHI